MNMVRAMLVVLSVILTASPALADQTPQWGGDSKAKTPAAASKGATSTVPPPPPPASSQRSTGAEPPPLPGNATLAGPVSYFAYAEVESNGTVRHAVGGDGQFMPSTFMGRNIRSIVREGPGQYLVTLSGSPAYPVCVATTATLDARYGCAAARFPRGISVSCSGPSGSGSGQMDLRFVIQCMAP